MLLRTFIVAGLVLTVGQLGKPYKTTDEQVAQLSQRDRTAGWVSYLVMAKVEDCNWDTIFTDIIGVYSTTVTYLASKQSNQIR